jgi:hypothetical protein
MRTFPLAAGLGALVSLTGCSTFIGGDLVREGEPIGQIVLNNQSGIGIDVVTISRCSAMSHGLNALSSGEIVYSGRQRTWTVNAGCWDVGAGRTGTCAGGGCSWNEAYQRVEVPANRAVTVRFTPAG